MKSLIKNINRYEDNQQRLDVLKNLCKEETAYLVTCGPSLTTHNREKLISKLEGKLVIACKQAYEYVKEVSTFHLLSVYNYQPYEYFSEDTIRHWQLTGMNIPNELSKIQEWNQRIDIMLPVYSTPWIQKNQSTAFTGNFDNWKLYSEGKALWGPGIMYESGFPLAIHLGCKKIVTIGWDIGDLSKYPTTEKMAVDKDWMSQHAKDLYKVDVGAGPEYEELYHTIKCTTKMYDWSLKNKIEINILSDTNPADERFKRITFQEL